MQQIDKISEYCNKVCDQIRWKKAKKMISIEIENHLTDQRDAYVKDGENMSSATEKSIEQMGDAVTIGQELDKTHRPKPQLLMILMTLSFMLAGIIINHLILTNAEDGWRLFSIEPYIYAMIVFLICYHIDFTILGRYAKKIYYLSLVFSFIVIFYALLRYGNIIYVWISAFAYMSLIFPLLHAVFVYSMRNTGYKGVFICSIAYLPFMFSLFIVGKNWLSSDLVLCAVVSVSVLCFSINRGWFNVDKRKGILIALTPILILLIAVSIFLILSDHYLFQRFEMIVNTPLSAEGLLNSDAKIYLELRNIYYEIRETLFNSVIFGQGHKLPEYLSGNPNVLSSEYSLLYLSYQFGLIFMVAVIFAIITFSVIGMKKALKEKSMLGSIVSFTIMMTFICQSIIFILNNLGFGLFDTVSLPFISYGKTALLIDSALIGFMLSVFRTGEVFSDSFIYKGKVKI